MLTYHETIVRLCLSAILGSLVGLERERLDWAAGLRTHMLVSVGATMFMLVSTFGFADIVGRNGVALDPSRVAAQVVSGIGFLGAGTIIFRREVIRGLTTAASLWSVAGIGLAVGGGLYVAAASATLLVLIILVGMKPIENRLFVNQRPRRIRIRLQRGKAALGTMEAILADAHLRLEHIAITPLGEEQVDLVQLTLQRTDEDRLLPLLERLREVDGVVDVSHALK